ncbi:MAG: Stk1 family PASTA domain-containing Ser/Thr kinase [Bulleidia sp.]
MSNSKNLIANRYEVFQHIGQGGMADVFLAVDTILNRQVAIKILRSELCTDAVSVLRFEREAQAATALSHPNIVEIYDVGEYKGHHYIVMEYVPGKTLKKVIQQRGALLKEEAVDIMKQLLSATAEAHRRGIIHRDIKPQNVIVKSDGSVKILDFGIALAKGSMQLTQANNVMGSVHYLAPELARGESATAQSDIYALGIVLFEMLTGDVPFKADSAVQVALMQMKNEMPSARDINPSIPQSLENVIIRATAKDPAQRYRSCNEMLDDIRTCLRPERLNEPKLYLPKASPKRLEDLEEAKEPARTPSRKNRPAREETEEPARVSHPAVGKKPKGNKPLFIILIVLLCLLGVSGIYLALNASGILNPASREREVPQLIGLSLADARTLCEEKDLVLNTDNVTYTLTENTEKGQIISSSPDAGTTVEEGTEITVTVSSGIGVTMKDYTGWNINDAMNDIAQNYPSMQVKTEESQDDSKTPGTVISQDGMAAGTMFNPEAASEVTLVYASYPTITIPDDLNGKTIEEATAELEALGVKVLTSNLDTSSLTEEEIGNLQTGVVISSDPQAGSEFTQREDNYVILYYY